MLLVLAVRPPLPLPSSSLDPRLQQPILVAFLGKGPAARPYIAVYVCNEVIQRGADKQGQAGANAFLALIPRSFSMTIVSPLSSPTSLPTQPSNNNTRHPHPLRGVRGACLLVQASRMATCATRERASKKGERTACGTKEYTTYTPHATHPSHHCHTHTTHNHEPQESRPVPATAESRPAPSFLDAVLPAAHAFPPSLPPLCGPPPLPLLLGNNGQAQSNNTHDNKRAR